MNDECDAFEDLYDMFVFVIPLHGKRLPLYLTDKGCLRTVVPENDVLQIQSFSF